MKKLYLVAAAVAVISTPLSAQVWSAFTPQANGGEYWDNASTDGPGCNVGYVLTGAPTGACTDQRPAGWLPYGGPSAVSYWNNGSGGFYPILFAPLDGVSFSRLTGEPADPNCCDVAGGDADWGYWSGTHATTVSLNGALGGGPVGVDFSGLWGFWMKMGDTGLIRYSDTDNQFAAFRITPDRLIITFEDVEGAGSDRDYNDTYVQITAVQGGTFSIVPEPATMTLLATGLAGMAAAGRRRKAKK